jgi:hypothetical protein
MSINLHENFIDGYYFVNITTEYYSFSNIKFAYVYINKQDKILLKAKCIVDGKETDIIIYKDELRLFMGSTLQQAQQNYPEYFI